MNIQGGVKLPAFAGGRGYQGNADYSAIPPPGRYNSPSTSSNDNNNFNGVRRGAPPPPPPFFAGNNRALPAASIQLEERDRNFSESNSQQDLLSRSASSSASSSYPPSYNNSNNSSPINTDEGNRYGNNSSYNNVPVPPPRAGNMNGGMRNPAIPPSRAILPPRPANQYDNNQYNNNNSQYNNEYKQDEEMDLRKRQAQWNNSPMPYNNNNMMNNNAPMKYVSNNDNNNYNNNNNNYNYDKVPQKQWNDNNNNTNDMGMGGAGGKTLDGNSDDYIIEKVGTNEYIIDTTPLVWKPPPDVDQNPYKPHQGEGAQYLRDFILGMNDGLISTLLLVVTLVGGGNNSRTVLLAAIAGAIAGSISMGLGEFIATKAQNEVTDGETELDKIHFKYHRDRELKLLRGYLVEVGLEGPLLEVLIRKIGENDDALIKVMEKFKFGTDGADELERSPIKSMIMSGRLFLLGSLPSTIPFLLNDTNIALAVALSLSSVTLILVGVYKTRTTGGSPYRGAAENFAAGALGAGLSYGVGVLYSKIAGVPPARGA